MSQPDRKSGHPMRADQLQRRDQVVLFGRLIEIADVQPVRDFPGTVNLVILPAFGGQPRETLVPRDMLLLGVRVMRVLQLKCAGCQSLTPKAVDLAVGVKEKPICVGCKARAVSTPTGPWLTPAGRY